MLVLIGWFSAAAAPPPSSITVPTQDLAPGTVLTVEVLGDVPDRRPTDGARHVVLAPQLVGRTAQDWLIAGEAVDNARLTDPERGLGVQALLDHGQRAVWVGVGSVLGVEVGSYARVVEAPPEGDATTTTWTAPVLAIDATTSAVMLVVPPRQAQHLARPLPRWVALANPIDVTREERHGPIEIDRAAQEGSVAVARRALTVGVRIERTDVYLTNDGHGLSLDWVVGRIPRQRILAGEAIRNERLADPVHGVGLFAVIPRGMVGMPLRVPRTAGIEPGNYVDVVASSSEAHTTTTLFQAIFVLDVAPSEAMLLLTRDQAARVGQAQGRGDHLSLPLRNDLDVEIKPLEPERWGPPPEPPAPAKRRRRGR